ncbi:MULTISPECIES: potassium-transporting ATPase subunit KdpC [unclassified Janthinobacterium]|uniref:potassium-transporting ATPase subunit KdpC n=1 Tax=unclassified Janthinobacterium TaxID=2610881 RepID=UPI001621966B|nr:MULTISPECIES: potassium-transporting ATPase subunit KdpC [unclassified Janthinobacterium]MBB5367974.1 K+-transporting ATPase ATPase C chain [Janthinobacterium sp. K2C7]MBB5379548.1 K+-transporting ATPase ATPase C chain [Janthinobacterium sp. K2Li3]MBB5386356.1 K+-transporting ATPase ATPase C chain [Janthinobacterium sp. K2E3]
MSTIVRPAVVLFAALTVICGVIYPLATTGIGKLAFSHEVDGSIIERDGKPVGSTLIGQSFTSPKYFWGRPSATSPMANNGAGSGGSNLGPSNPALVDAVKGRIAALKEADPDNTTAIPVDLVTASGSGLDPEISLAAAVYQARRVARVRGLHLAQVENTIAKLQKTAYIGFFGEPRVNVLELNLALDAAQK